MSQNEISHEKWMGTPIPQGYPPLLMPSGMSQLRLSLTSATPVTTADVTSGATLFLEAYQGNRIMLPTEWGEWRAFSLPRTPAGLYEVGHAFVANSRYAIASATVYDVFAFVGHGGFVDFEIGPAWSSATARAAAGALAVRDGAQVKATDPTRLLIGTIYASGTNTVDDSAAKRFLWNRFNRNPRFLKAVDTTNTWTYSTASWRQANAAAANQVAFVLGLSADVVYAVVHGQASGSVSGGIIATGVGISSTTVNSAQLTGGECSNLATSEVTAEYYGFPGIGYYYLVWLEIAAPFGAETITWVGDLGKTYIQSGIAATIWA